jgi:hypothetical protein
MLSEDFDKKIRDAADHHHPNYDEKAWSGMKKLLDKHMPEEKENKRRFFFILFFILLLGGGAWLVLEKRMGPAKKDSIATTRAVQTTGGEPATSSSKQVGQQGNESVSPVGIITDPVKNSEPGTVEPVSIDQNHGTADPNAPVSRKSTGNTTKSDMAPVSLPVNKKLKSNKSGSGVPVVGDESPVFPVTTGAVNKDDLNKTTIVAPQSKNEPGTSPTVATKTQPTETIPASGKAVVVAKPDEKKPEDMTSVTKKEKPKSKKKNNFFFTLSGGPDASFTGNDKFGRTKIVGGAGVGYTIREKFTLRSGFYTARKLYTSSPGEYNMSPWVSSYYPNLQKVEADCKVYEIPVTVSYNFKSTEKYSLFASAGLSSYIMKRETYDFYYKYSPTGPVVNRAYTAHNENKHYFSVLNLSAGYQRNISKRLSLTAEPYYKVPLKGVGEGKVKLNSTGVLFTLSVKPFGSAEKK